MHIILTLSQSLFPNTYLKTCSFLTKSNLAFDFWARKAASIFDVCLNPLMILWIRSKSTKWLKITCNDWRYWREISPGGPQISANTIDRLRPNKISFHLIVSLSFLSFSCCIKVRLFGFLRILDHTRQAIRLCIITYGRSGLRGPKLSLIRWCPRLVKSTITVG